MTRDVLRRTVSGVRGLATCSAVAGALVVLAAFMGAPRSGGSEPKPPGDGPTIAVTLQRAYEDGSNGGFTQTVLATVKADGSSIRAHDLVPGGYAPRYSPDGRWVAFCASADTGAQLRIMGTSGGAPRAVAQVRACSASAWAPDGRTLIFSADDGFLYRVGVDGRGLRHIANGSDPAWSSRGLIAFVGPRTSGIVVMRPDGSGRRYLTGGDTDDAPDWAPDGRRLVFTRGAGSANDPPAIYCMHFDGGRLQLLGHGFTPAWSPSGTRVAFTRPDYRPGNPNEFVYQPEYSDLFVMLADGSHVRRIAAAAYPGENAPGRLAGDQSLTQPTWQPRPR